MKIKKHLYLSLILITPELFFPNSAISNESRKEIECTFYGAYAVDYRFSLIEGDFYIDGKKSESIVSPNKVAELVKTQDDDGEDAYIYAALENAGGHAIEYVFTIVFEKVEATAIVNDQELSSDCRDI